MERIPKGGKGLFLDERENEANVDAIGLDRVYVGKVSSEQPVSKYWKMLTSPKA